MDYKEMYFKLYADFADIMEQIKDIMQKYEDIFCDIGIDEDDK